MFLWARRSEDTLYAIVVVRIMGVVRAFRREPEAETRPVVKPPLKWAGGKRWQLPELLPYWRAHSRRRLVEPFCGGLAVATGLVPEKALLNDVNPHVINFYQCLKKGLSIEFSMQNESHAYYRARERFNDLLATGKGATEEAAGLFYYLNRTGYNGLCRFNSKGGFNVPFGRYKTIPYRSTFEEYPAAFRGWMFTCMDFDRLEVEPTDFIYADPPYDVPFTTYSKGGFSWEDQVRAAKWLSRHKGPVILSNQATKRIVELYESLNFELHTLDAPRRISCTGDRTPAREVLALRNLR